MLFEQFEDVLTTDDVCIALRIGKNALYELLQSGQLKGFRNGRVWRIPKESLITFVLGQSGLR